MNKCPNCGHEWPDDKRAKGGKARWKGTTKKTRSAAAAKAAKARWQKSENDEMRDRSDSGTSQEPPTTKPQ